MGSSWALTSIILWACCSISKIPLCQALVRNGHLCLPLLDAVSLPSFASGSSLDWDLILSPSLNVILLPPQYSCMREPLPLHKCITWKTTNFHLHYLYGPFDHPATSHWDALHILQTSLWVVSPLPWLFRAKVFPCISGLFLDMAWFLPV